MIHTQRLLLRPIAREDFDRWAEFLADPEASRYIGGVQARAVAWRSMMTMAGAWALTGVSMFSVVERASGKWIGRIGPWQPEGWPGTEVGWGLHPDAWGKGYAYEAAHAAVEYAFSELGWNDVIHTIGPDNHSSRRVAERLGARLRGDVALPPPHHNVPVQMWGQTRDEWRARTAVGTRLVL